MILEQVFSVKPKSKEREKNIMTENDKVRDLANTSRNAKRLVDQVEEAHYGLNVPQLVQTVEKLADVMARILDKEAER